MLAPTHGEATGFLYHRTEWLHQYQFMPWHINAAEDMTICKRYCKDKPFVSIKLIIGPNIEDRVLSTTSEDDSFLNKVKVITFLATDEKKQSDVVFTGKHLHLYTALKKLDLNGATGVTFRYLKKCINVNRGLIFLGLKGFAKDSMKKFIGLLELIPKTLLILTVPNWKLKTNDEKPWTSISTNILNNVRCIDFTGAKIEKKYDFVRTLIANSDNLRRIYGIQKDQILLPVLETRNETLYINIYNKVYHDSSDTSALTFDVNNDNREEFLGPKVTLLKQLILLSEAYGIDLE